MPYSPPKLPAVDTSVPIHVAIGEHLKQAHYLLAMTYPGDGQTPNCHFGKSAVVMMLLTIAAVSVLRYFDIDANRKADPRKDKTAKSDRDAFIETVENFFPWGNVTVEDGRCRPEDELPKLAATELYEVFRNPFVHTGGMTSKLKIKGRTDEFFRAPNIIHTFPGLATPNENEAAISEYTDVTLSGDVLLKMGAFQSVVYSRPLYWCTRKMIENFAADPAVQRDLDLRFFRGTPVGRTGAQ